MGLAPLFVLLAPLDIGTDPRLAKPLTIERRLIPADEALAEIGKGVGLRLDCARALASRKLVLFVEGPSVGRTLVRIADVLRADWEVEKGGYRLVANPRREADKAAYVREWDDGDPKRLKSDLQAIAPYARFDRADLAKRAKRAQEAVQGAIRPGEPASPEYLRLNEEAKALGKASQNYDLAVVAAQLGGDGWDRLMNGDLVSAGVGASYRMDESDAAPERLYLRRDPATGALQVRSESAIPNGRQGMIQSPTLSNPSNLSEAAHRFEEEIDRWAQSKCLLPDRPLDPKVPMAPAWTWSNRPTSPDHLEWLHRASGLPIVALGTRRSEFGLEPRRPNTLAVFWNWFKDEGSLRTEDGFVEFRPYAFWADREPDEAWFRRLEATSQPSLDQYATLVAELPANVSLPSINDIQTSVCPTPFASASALRFLGLLKPDARRRLLGGGRLMRDDLPASAARAFEAAILGGLFQGSAWARGGLFDALARPETMSTHAGYGVFASDAGDICQEAAGSDRYAVLGQKAELVPGIRLAFGFGPNDAMVYEIYRLGLPPSARPLRNSPW